MARGVRASRVGRWLVEHATLALFALLALTSLAIPRTVWAQELPPDIPIVSSDVVLPAAPEGFVHVDRGNVRWEMPERARPLVEPLFETWDAALPRIQRELGIEGAMPPILVRVGVDPEQMAALAPEGAPPPAYAVGVAYPGLSLILLTLTAPETWQRPELEQVLVHELSHIALEQALRDEHGRVQSEAPLWLVEGVAIYQARERSIERVQTLWEAAFRGGVIDLDDLDERFPSRPHAVSLAYAESADFVGWLLRRSGPHKLGDMLARMRRGQRFETAVSQTWSLGIGSLELEWRESLSERFGALPMFATGSAGWVLVGVLVVLAWRRRKERVAAIEKRWAEEDEREEQLARAWARHRARLLARERARRLAEEGISFADGVPVSSTASPPREIVTSETREKPTTVFVVGSTAAPMAAPTEAAAQEASAAEPHDPPFETDLERGDRALH
ncbi:MAG: peptidase MA family metallohydrolase [Sandaracinus sp.]